MAGPEHRGVVKRPQPLGTALLRKPRSAGCAILARQGSFFNGPARGLGRRPNSQTTTTCSCRKGIYVWAERARENFRSLNAWEVACAAAEATMTTRKAKDAGWDLSNSANSPSGLRRDGRQLVTRCLLRSEDTRDP